MKFFVGVRSLFLFFSQATVLVAGAGCGGDPRPTTDSLVRDRQTGGGKNHTEGAFLLEYVVPRSARTDFPIKKIIRRIED